ncbi:MAG: tyrosine-type recombinase/integrase [Cyanobacteria bacterium REEB67]|nr:tyrosine-type recombinase/integrase [Cyanobacteria bacterium REEB67]
MPNITIEFVKRTNEPGTYRDEKLPGFTLFIGKGESGIKSYQVNGRIKGGRPIFYTIGRHGTWNATTAREEAGRILRLMAEGIDPRAGKSEVKAAHVEQIALDKAEAAKSEFTLRRAFEQWHAESHKTKDRTKELYQQMIYKHLKDWLDLPVAEITAQMVADRYNKVADVSVGSAGNTFRALRMLFNWLLIRQEDLPAAEQIIVKNPVTVLHRRDLWRELKPRTKFITKKELPRWFQAVQEIDNPMYCDYFQFVLVTGLRLTEASKLHWADIDFDNSVFTARDTKNGSDHTLPMTDFTRQIFERRLAAKKNDFVFPAKTGTGYFRDARHWIRIVKQRTQGPGQAGIEFTCHMLRKTLSNYAMDVNLTDGQRKMILNHTNRADVTEHHYTTKDAERMREPLTRVEKYILEIGLSG